MITPEEFYEKMVAIKKEWGIEGKNRTETLHEEMDWLMEDVLIELGYGKGIEIFNSVDVWYA